MFAIPVSFSMLKPATPTAPTNRFGRVPHPEEVVEQRYLPALVCLDQECLTQIIQVAIGLGTEGLLKG